jgi:hypothetical protein
MPSQSVLPFSSMELGEIATTAKDASFIVDKAPVDDLTALLHRVNSRSKETIKQVELISGNDLSASDGSSLSNSDKVRDDQHEEIRAHVDGLRSNLKPAIKAAAINVYNRFIKHDLNTPRLAYPVATHNYNALVTELQSEELAQDVKILEIQEGIEKLRQANDSFVQLHRILVGEKNNGTDSSEIDTCTSKLSKYLNQTVSMLEALVAEDAALYKGVADEVNALLNEIRSKVHARKTRKENSKDAAEKEKKE